MNAEFTELLRCPLTGSPLRLEAFERAGDRIEYGTLTGQGGEYPIVTGIPIFTSNQQETVSLLRSGDQRIAIAMAAVGNRYTGALDTLLKSNPIANRLRRFTKPRDQRRKRAWLERAAECLAPRNGGQLTAQGLYEFGYLRCGPPSNEAFHYNYCRFGMPGYFVGLSFLEAIGARDGFVLDHSCGSGHLTWAMRRACKPAQVIGCDISFLSLYIARQTMEPEAWYVCADVTQLPFRDGVFAAVFNSDAFNNFSSKLMAFQEMARTASASAPIALVWLRNSLHEHMYGKPVSAEAYRGIAGAHSHRMYSDAWVLRRFLGQSGDIPDPGDEVAARESTFSMWISKDAPQPAHRFGATPIPLEQLTVNPIYKTTGPGAFERDFPSSFFASEDSDKKYYYPERFTLNAEQQEALRNNRADGLQDLLRTGAIAGRPERFA